MTQMQLFVDLKLQSDDAEVSDSLIIQYVVAESPCAYHWDASHVLPAVERTLRELFEHHWRMKNKRDVRPCRDEMGP